jgi:hypothetical protein
MEQEIKTYLEREPKARERRNRSRAIVNLLLKQYPELLSIPKDKLCDFIHSADSYDRIFRKVLVENPHLRGKDYEDKTALEQGNMLQLGYEVGHYQDIKRLNKLL